MYLFERVDPLRFLRPFAFVLAWLLAPNLDLCADDPNSNSESDLFFVEQVEPILKQHCFGCHSHTAGEMEGGLTLDWRGGWLAGGERGPAIVPGKPDESLLVRAIRRQDDQLSMPPEEKLSQQEVDLLVRWVSAGAYDPRVATAHTDRPIQQDPNDWWSLRPLVAPEVPKYSADLHPIDAFVQQRLDAKGLSPVPQADRSDLIRRATFDLHGLPPTPEEVAAFVADRDPLAFEKLVDRLLDSPRYGERWARHWLDSVHFADSHGCEHDVFRPGAWRYRDYVIESFNSDTPWSRFIREQLAADYFFPEQTDLTVALGFIAAGPLELSRAGTAPVTFDYLDRDDIVTQTMAAFTSTTANCARCHDHKFDPITQEDYYSLQAVFAGVGKGAVAFDGDPAVAKARQRWTELVTNAKTRTLPKPLGPELREVVDQWEERLGTQTALWESVTPATFVSSDGATLKRLADSSLLVAGTRPAKDTYTITAPIALTKLSAFRLDVLADDRLPMKGPGRADNGNLHLSEVEAFVFDPETTEPTRVKISRAVADWDQEGWTIAHAIDGDIKTAWGIYPKVGQSHHAAFELEEKLELKLSSQIVVVLKQLHGGSHLIGRLKLYVTDADDAAAEVVPEVVRAATKVPRSERAAEHQAAIDSHVIRIHAEEQLSELPPKSLVYAVSNRYSHAKQLDQPIKPKVVHVLRRGDIDSPGEIAVPGAIATIDAVRGRFNLSNLDDEPARRAALADWLAAPENPLTWRSVVNRVWAYHFGVGICDTPNDFGRMGGTPSHGELLDWLAVWFRDDAHGSLKQLHRLILLSATYQRQSQSSDAVAASTDADNRLLWRMNRRQLDAESFRDAVLQISGRLDLEMGGPGIQQFIQSKGPQATPLLDYDAFDWNDSSAARRSIYRVVWRGIADPFMESLDFPDLGLLAPKREFSVSALQSLALYNNDFVLHHCQVLADTLKENHAAIDDQVGHAVRLIYLREPSHAEQTALVSFCQRHGLAAMCRVLFNSNEFIFVD